MMNRRSFVTTSVACTACLGSLAKKASSEQIGLPPYCSIDSSFNIDQYRRMSRSGDSRLDRALIVELRKLIKAFRINPGFQYIDDLPSPNAFALERSLIEGTEGTVLFGINLIKSEMASDFGGAAVAGIAAHEGAHVMQFHSDFGSRLASNTAREMELHADFMAGYYFSQTDRTERSLLVFGESLFEKGDYDFNNEQHHGTPDERLTAMKTGYDQKRRGRSLTEAIEVGIEHVHA